MRGADLRSVDQLTPEPAEEISQADQVIFIDARDGQAEAITADGANGDGFSCGYGRQGKSSGISFHALANSRVSSLPGPRTLRPHSLLGVPR
jgi:hypothetical protein